MLSEVFAAMLKRRPSKRFVLAESGEDSTWDPTVENPEEANSAVPTIIEPETQQKENDEMPPSETKTLQEHVAEQFEEEVPNTKLLRITTSGLKYVKFLTNCNFFTSIWEEAQSMIIFISLLLLKLHISQLHISHLPCNCFICSFFHLLSRFSPVAMFIATNWGHLSKI